MAGKEAQRQNNYLSSPQQQGVKNHQSTANYSLVNQWWPCFYWGGYSVIKLAESFSFIKDSAHGAGTSLAHVPRPPVLGPAGKSGEGAWPHASYLSRMLGCGSNKQRHLIGVLLLVVGAITADVTGG